MSDDVEVKQDPLLQDLIRRLDQACEEVERQGCVTEDELRKSIDVLRARIVMRETPGNNVAPTRER